MGHMKAQAAVEYLVIVALSLAILMPTLLYVEQTKSNVESELKLNYAQQAVNELRNAADLAYTQGPPAQFYVEVLVPLGVNSVSINGNLISIYLETPYGLSEVYANTIGNVTGALPSFSRFQGPRRVLVKAEQNYSGYFVNITEGN